MAIDRELVLQLAAQRAGFNGNQLDALRRGDYAALLAEQIAAAPESALTPDPSNSLAADFVPDYPPDSGPGYASGHGADDMPVAGSDMRSAADLQARLARVSRRLVAVRQQRNAALHVLRQLAAKLGCCARCWGTDAACATCAGHGSPGHFPPDPQLREWLAPALVPGSDAEPYEAGPGLFPGKARDPLPARAAMSAPVTSTVNRGER
ncbi:hypothetical protein [Streptomyces sp. NPDC056948]|uniref:hypothetical protein n=1 Tax=Streptomyces sp. NPDC056948 TaxID=3345975 RepID=UPI00363A8EC8